MEYGVSGGSSGAISIRGLSGGAARLYSLDYSEAKTYITAALFGMPMHSALPAILLKSVLLAGSAGYVAHRWNKVSIPLMMVLDVVLG